MRGRGGKNNFRGGRGGKREVRDSYENPRDSEPCSDGLHCQYLYARAGCLQYHPEDEKRCAGEHFILKKFYNFEAAAFLKADGSLSLVNFTNIKVHLEQR